MAELQSRLRNVAWAVGYPKDLLKSFSLDIVPSWAILVDTKKQFTA